MSCACGPDWLPTKLVHWFFKIPEGEQCFFHDACVQHDLEYMEGEISRAQSDQIFLTNMITTATKNNVSFENLSRAIRYYQFVRYFGFISYYFYYLKRILNDKN